VGSSQVYLTSFSAASFGQVSTLAHIVVARGTVGFSASAPDRLELETPAGILRGESGQPVFGQVTLSGPQEMLISAYRGNLILDNDGEFHTISEGKTYRVTIDSETSAASSDDEPKNVHRKKRRKLGFFLLGGAAAVAGYFIYQEASESPSDPH
jgi:hypothetical protein